MPDQSTNPRVALEWKIHASAQGLLYDVAKRVRSGYCWWFADVVDVDKLPGLITKFHQRYGVGDDAMKRHRRKVAGEPSATLFVWPLRNDKAGWTTRFGFLLLATERLDGEIMYDGRHRPIRIGIYSNGNAVYHLMPSRKTGRKQAHALGERTRKAADKAQPTLSYTWQLSAKSLELMRQRFEAEISHPAALDSLRRGYGALPMTSGYRAQFRELLTELRPAWKRATTPAALLAKQQIKEGLREDPLSVRTLPYIRGFPTLYDNPPVTLGMYLAANTKRRKEIERRNQQRVLADHELAGVRP